MTTISNYKKHLKLSERIKIEKGLELNLSFRSISKDINKGISTISREIFNRREKEKGNHFNNFNKKCKSTNKAPFVCNGCPNRKKCKCDKFYYSAENAHNDYLKTLVESREGIDQTTEEFKNIKKTVKEGLDKGHSFALIIHNNHDLNITERTLYNYQENNLLGITNVSLPRKVRYKKRKRNVSKSKKDRNKDSYRINRNYNDFLTYIKENSITYYTEMDTVEGIIGKGEACFLTLYLKQSEFLFVYKISEQTITSVNNKIKEIKSLIGNEAFHEIFPIILTDNGSEFKRPFEIEDNGKHVIDSKVFYCDAQRSDQKSQIELSHEYIRRFIPKGFSINNYTDENIQNMMNHINSTPRKSLNWKSPYDVFVEMFGEDILKKLNISKIESKEIILNAKLFKNNK